jgi:hypothetical protein
VEKPSFWSLNSTSIMSCPCSRFPCPAADALLSLWCWRMSSIRRDTSCRCLTLLWLRGSNRTSHDEGKRSRRSKSDEMFVLCFNILWNPALSGNLSLKMARTDESAMNPASISSMLTSWPRGRGCRRRDEAGCLVLPDVPERLDSTGAEQLRHEDPTELPPVLAVGREDDPERAVA